MIPENRVVRLVTTVMSLCLLVASAREVSADDRQEARRHLKVGVTLFNERNYEAALVEFEASYHDLPSASALQNIALCQTKLFRYVDAIDTLRTLQAKFGNELSPQEAAKVDEALGNLSQLVGTLELSVTPSNATVTLHGKPVPPEQLRYPLRLSSGEYRLEVTAPHHETDRRTIKVAGGESEEISIRLEAMVGWVSVQVNDEAAAIAIDGVPLAYGAWAGNVPAGEHTLQVYKPGHRSFGTKIRVRQGDRMELSLKVGPTLDATDTPAPAEQMVGLPYRHAKTDRSPLEPVVGWYGLVTATNLAVLRSPDGFEADDDADVAGGSFGLRAGYRFGEYIGIEGMFDSGGQSVSGMLQDKPETYDLTTRRYGGNVRLLLGGSNARFSGTFGVGAVWHRLKLGGRTYAGTNSYFELEAGPQFNVGQVLLGGVTQLFVEGATNARDGEARVYTDRTVLVQVGIGLRVGFSQWGTW